MSTREKEPQVLARVGLALALSAAAGCEADPVATTGSSQTRPAAPPVDPAPQPHSRTTKRPPDSHPDIDGEWLASSQNSSFTIELTAQGQRLRGAVRAPDGSVAPIKIGVFSRDAFLFETSGDKTGWYWSGQFSADGLKGYRENVHSGEVEAFTARRSK